MKLLYSALSPYARKVRILILEKGLSDSIQLVESDPYESSLELLEANPLGKVPALIRSDGPALFDSAVICEFVDTLGGPRMQPVGKARIPALHQLALTQGLIDATFNISCELNRRAENERSSVFVDRWSSSIRRSTAAMAIDIARYGRSIAMPHIAAVCALDYLDLRASDIIDWRHEYKQLADWYEEFGERSAMRDTRPHPTI
ncbi:MAG: glutathione S-transferase [Granulosicoccus sp.]